MIQKYSLSFSFQNSTRVLKLKEYRNCRQDASFSFIMSAAFFITENLPLLRPPIQVKGQWPPLKVTLQQPLQNKIYHPFAQLWNDLIIIRTCKRSALLHQDIAFIDIQLKQSDSHHFNDSKLFEEIFVDQSSTKMQRLRKIFNLMTIQITNKNMAIFTTHPTLAGYPFAPRIHMNALLLGLYFNNQQWSTFDLTEGQLPSVQEITQLDGVIISGSRLSVLDSHSAMHQALENLQLAMEANKKLRVFGVCFGHQLISKYFNGKVERRTRKAGLEQILFNEQIISGFPFLNEILQKRNRFLQCQHHQDYVIQVPKSFLLLGKSQSCAIESLLREDGRILTTQFHTEFSLEYFTKFKTRTRYFYNNNQLYEQQELETRQREEQSKKDAKIWVKCIRHYFKQSA